MHRLYCYFLVSVFLILLPFISEAAQSNPWRNIDPIPASRIRWKGLTGADGEDKTHLYSIKARGSNTRPYPERPRYPVNVQEYMESWLSQHPKARAVPVEAYPFLSASLARVYVWIVEGDENLNIHLVREGFFRASTQLPTLRTADLLVSASEFKSFRKKIIAAEIAAANAGKGIWVQDDRDPRYPPGKLEFPGMRKLVEFERMTENVPAKKPPPAYGPETLEGDLLNVFYGDDKTASYSARVELLRRAESEELSREAFSSLIAAGLDLQAGQWWPPFYGSLIHLAFQQGMLSEKLLKRYTRQAITFQFQTKPVILQPDRPMVDLTIVGEGRFGTNKAPKIIKGNQTSLLLLTTAFHIDQVKIDGLPVINGATGKKLVETWWRQTWRGKKVKKFLLLTDPSLAPGNHTLTGVLTIHFLLGIIAWNAVGNRNPPPGEIQPLLEYRYNIELSFSMDG